MEKIVYKKVKQPVLDCTNIPVMLSDETMQQRLTKVKTKMKQERIDTLIIYADLEHGSNFEYLSGFLPRFEEALLVLHQDGKAYMLMGNENLNKVTSARIEAEAIHVPYFSLPNQPMENDEPLASLLKKAGIHDGRIGLVGWKKFTSRYENNQQLFDFPYYIVDELKKIVKGEIFNAIDLFIGYQGVRCVNNVNELEHYEFGASLASDCMLRAMNQLEVGVREVELGATLNALGQKNSVVTIAATGKRFIKANLYPTERKVQLQDTISLTVGYKGGLSSRAGYALQCQEQLPADVQDYLDVLVKPYYNAVVKWLESIHCGLVGGDLYQIIEEVLPKKVYHWSLCPGHLTADEEWMSSPIYKGSKEVLESGMLLQIDIIPSLKGYGGTSAESTIALADEKLRRELQEKAPQMWQRIVQRREYIEKELKIKLHEDVLPMCSSVGYLRPFLLEKEKAMAKQM